jgi:isoleucyl-tRNA synthetase
LEVIAQLSAPIAPFFMERLFTDLNSITHKIKAESIHLSDFPVVNESHIDASLEERMELAQKISSMVLSIRKKENIRVRQPLAKIQIPVLDDAYKAKIEAVKDLILSEVNVKSLDLVDESHTQIVKQLKLNFKTLGKKCGKHMKAVQVYATNNAQEIITGIEKEGKFEIVIEGDAILLEIEDTEIIPVDIPGWKVANAGQLTVALDVTITDELREEGLARELVNRIQNHRKERNFELTDRIVLKIKEQKEIKSAVNHNLEYICTEILADRIEFVSETLDETAILLELGENLSSVVQVNKV